jgi:hypothetical protein
MAWIWHQYHPIMSWNYPGSRSSSGWGFKIDYDRAIADDDLLISHAQRSIDRGWYRRSIQSTDGTWVLEVVDLWQLILYFRDVADAAGYSAQDVSDLAGYLEVDVWKLHPDLPDCRSSREGYLRGKSIMDEIQPMEGMLYQDEVSARAGLRRAKASRARHVRNREKYGRR